MVNLYVFDKATKRVVAVVQGPDAVSCEHAAGHVDEHGNQPYCTEKLGWVYESNAEFAELENNEVTHAIMAHKFDPSAPPGTPGGPHRMTQEQFDEHVRRQNAELEQMAARSGLKVRN